jgi:hypothetical protein
MSIEGNHSWNERERRVLAELERDVRFTAARARLGHLGGCFARARCRARSFGVGADWQRVFISLSLLLADGVAFVAAGTLSSVPLAMLAGVILPCVFVPFLKGGSLRRGALQRRWIRPKQVPSFCRWRPERPRG